LFNTSTVSISQKEKKMKRISPFFVSVLLAVLLTLVACSGNQSTAPAATPEPAATEVPATQSSAPSATEAVSEQPQNAEKVLPMLHIAMVKGQVEIRENADGQFAPAQAGQKIGVGVEIRTGTDGIVALYRDTLSMVVLDQSSAMVVKKLAFKDGKPITILFLIKGAAAVEHNGKLPEGAMLSIETPNQQVSGVLGSTVRVSFDTSVTPPVMTATCISGECNFVKGDQTLSLQEGQQIDVTGMVPLPGMPNVMEISEEQANQFLAQAHAMCGCDLPISEIRDTGLTTLAPPEDGVPSPEEDLQNSADENGNTDPATDEVSGEEIEKITEDESGEGSGGEGSGEGSGGEGSGEGSSSDG
jgi:hypothetical protein